MQIAIGLDQISEISISMLHTFAALFTVYLKSTLHANHEYLIVVHELFAQIILTSRSDKGYPGLLSPLPYVAQYLISLVGLPFKFVPHPIIH